VTAINHRWRKIFCVTLSALLFALCSTTEAQPAGKIPRIGYISGTYNPTNPGPYVEALRRGMRELGYTEGKNFIVEYRGAEGKLETIPGIVDELIRLKVDLLVLPFGQAIRLPKKRPKPYRS
jgi:hypothetical protein